MTTKAKKIILLKDIETGGGGGLNPIVTDGLVLWLHGADWAGGTANWLDRSSYAVNFPPSANGLSTDGTWITFNGTSGEFVPGDLTQYKITGALTLEARVKFTVTDTVARIIMGKYDTVTADRQYGLAQYNGVLRFYTSANGSTFKYQDTSGKNDGVEHHFLCTFNPSVKWETWVDGVKTNSVSTQIYSALFNGDAPFSVGSRPTGFYYGSLRTVRIYNRVLSDAEIATNFNSDN